MMHIRRHYPISRPVSRFIDGRTAFSEIDLKISPESG